jgi:hypothetical protein
MKNRYIKTLTSILVAVLYAGCSYAQSVTEQAVTVPAGSNISGISQEVEAMVSASAMTEIFKDYSIQTGSISRNTAAKASMDVLALANPTQLPLCLDILAPPMVLETQSKYKQDDSSKSSVDENALMARDKTVQPIRDAIRQLTAVAYATGDNEDVQQARAECVLQNIDVWASTKSLTVMRTVDAYLSRDRWVAEIALATQNATKRVHLSDQRKRAYGEWFGKIANDTVDAYTMRLGPKSKANNHRYWAGLSVAAIGFLLENQNFKNWGEKSFEIGACQVDRNGLLPAELSRGEKALDYHVYALRPLAAIVQLSVQNGEQISFECLDGFQRLAATTKKALQDPTEFEQFAGLRQTVKAQENSYSAALKLDAIGVF